MRDLLNATKLVFAEKKFFVWFIILFLLFIFLAIYIPASIIPGNDLAFQTSLLKLDDWILLVLSSGLTALLVIFFFYIVFHSFEENRKKQNINMSFLGVFAGVFATILSVFTCIACALPFIGFLSFGTTLFLAEHRILISTLAIFTVLICLYFSAQKVLGTCKICKI